MVEKAFFSASINVSRFYKSFKVAIFLALSVNVYRFCKFLKRRTIMTIIYQLWPLLLSLLLFGERSSLFGSIPYPQEELMFVCEFVHLVLVNIG